MISTELINIILLIFIILCAIASVLVGELISATFLLGCYSFFLAILWTVLGAPDVSFTEAMVGVGASTIFLLLGLFNTRHNTSKAIFDQNKTLGLLAVGLLGALFLWGAYDLPAFSDPHTPASLHVSPYYLKHALIDTHTPNAVTAIVADYRGFDTLLETAVIFTAGIACLLVMRRRL